jgi:hypothetical protein
LFLVLVLDQVLLHNSTQPWVADHNSAKLVNLVGLNSVVPVALNSVNPVALSMVNLVDDLRFSKLPCNKVMDKVLVAE